jgi:shikimate dehydrogenase
MSATVSGKTKVVGIFGYPIGHTLSPRMHNAAFQALGLDMIYLPFQVKPDDLEGALHGIRALNLVGVNLTQPHKSAALGHLDELSEEAEQIGAVNTVVNRGETLIGYNTDARGFLRSLQEDYGFDPRGKHAVVFGAGGAGRAICWALGRAKPKRLVIVNRTVEKAETLAKAFGGSAVEWDNPAIAAELSGADLVVNATSISLDLDPGELSDAALIYDILYAKQDSAFLCKAKERGARVASGLSMLLYQGVSAFELWTGAQAPVEAMSEALGL